MRSIEIDIDIHKAIEAARTDFSQTDNDILRLLLNFGKAPVASPAVTGGTGHGKPWRGFNRDRSKWIEVADGTPLQANYSGQEVHGVIDDGAILVEGKRHMNPSPALMENVTTKDGRRTHLNGWRLWKVCLGDKWRRLADL